MTGLKEVVEMRFDWRCVRALHRYHSVADHWILKDFWLLSVTNPSLKGRFEHEVPCCAD
jgi:hypothetical protein